MARSPELLNAYAVCTRHLRGLRRPAIAWDLGIPDPDRERAFHAVYYSLAVSGPACLPKPWGKSHSQALAVTQLQRWLETAEAAHAGTPGASPEAIALADAMHRFSLPMEPWRKVERGLAAIAGRVPMYDLSDLVVRARSLGSAPASAYFRLIAARQGTRRYCMAPGLDAEELSHDLGVFCYVVEVMRSVMQLDIHGQAATLLPLEVIDRHNLDRLEIAGYRNNREAPQKFFEMMNDLASMARRFYQSTLIKITQSAAQLPPEAMVTFDRYLAHPLSLLRTMQSERFSPVGLAVGYPARIIGTVSEPSDGSSELPHADGRA